MSDGVARSLPMELNINRLRERTHRAFITGHLSLLRRVAMARPVPLPYWWTLRRMVRPIYDPPNPLLPPFASFNSRGSALGVAELDALLRDDELGDWSLDAATIALLWKHLWRERPTTILECGAGLSTLVLARYAAMLDEACTVISLEQDAATRESVESRLAREGLDGTVHVLSAPLAEPSVYRFDEERLAALLGARRIDWLLIDGPCGPPGCRVRTLPSLARWCRPGARWFLDDGFRDGELQVLSQWRSMDGLTVDGICAVGKGLATGTVDGPECVAAIDDSLATSVPCDRHEGRPPPWSTAASAAYDCRSGARRTPQTLPIP